MTCAPRPAVLLAMPQLAIAGKSIPYSVRVSRRARRLQLRITVDDGLEVVLPAGVSRSHIAPFLASQHEWILQRVDRYDSLRDQRGPALLEDGVEVLFRGEPQVVRIAPAAKARAQVAHRAGEIRLSLPPSADPSVVLENWMRQRAAEAIVEEIGRLNGDRRFPFERICLRDQKTRWGSCSRRGTLSFNWRLVMAPPEVLRYVVAHELAHTREPNHSPRFWQLLETLYGDPRPARQWLRDHGARLRWGQ